MRGASSCNGKRLDPLVIDDRPQERMLRLGATALSDAELLAMVLRSGTAQQNVVALSQSLLNEAGSLATFGRWNRDDFMRFSGIGIVKALQLCSIIELAHRLHRAEVPAPSCIKTPDDIAQLLHKEANALQIEKFWVICLNTRHGIIKVAEASSGTATSSLAHPREVFREAIRCSATRVAIAHNHPSGDPTPSSADMQVTRQLKEASKIISIELIDHVIIGRSTTDPNGKGWYSFRQSGLI